MGRRVELRLAVMAGLLISGAPALAHHGASAYDQSRTVSWEATVTEFEMANPHASILFDSKDPSGATVHWACELNSPSWLLREGWTRNTVKPGDHVTIVAHPNKKDEARVVFLMKVILSDGRVLANGPPQ